DDPYQQRPRLSAVSVCASSFGLAAHRLCGVRPVDLIPCRDSAVLVDCPGPRFSRTRGSTGSARPAPAASMSSTRRAFPPETHGLRRASLPGARLAFNGSKRISHDIQDYGTWHRHPDTGPYAGDTGG